MNDRVLAYLVSLGIIGAGVIWIVAGTYSATSELCIVIGLLTIAVGWISFVVEFRNRPAPTRTSLPSSSRPRRGKTPLGQSRRRRRPHHQHDGLDTAAPATQSLSNQVSGHRLPKTGIFAASAGDFW